MSPFADGFRVRLDGQPAGSRGCRSRPRPMLALFATEGGSWAPRQQKRELRGFIRSLGEPPETQRRLAARVAPALREVMAGSRRLPGSPVNWPCREVFAPRPKHHDTLMESRPLKYSSSHAKVQVRRFSFVATKTPAGLRLVFAFIALLRSSQGMNQ